MSKSFSEKNVERFTVSCAFDSLSMADHDRGWRPAVTVCHVASASQAVGWLVKDHPLAVATHGNSHGRGGKTPAREVVKVKVGSVALTKPCNRASVASGHESGIASAVLDALAAGCAVCGVDVAVACGVDEDHRVVP